MMDIVDIVGKILQVNASLMILICNDNVSTLRSQNISKNTLLNCLSMYGWFMPTSIECYL
jgi:hypothetical protein